MTDENGSADVSVDDEIAAIGQVHSALRKLDPGAQERVLAYVQAKLNLTLTRKKPEQPAEPIRAPVSPMEEHDHSDTGELEGISPVAAKWMKRNGLESDPMSKLFSLGVDEIDLVARSVPGSSKPDRLRSVCLLKGVAAYLSSGTARFTYDQMKTAAEHYDAWDSKNTARNINALTAEVTGAKETGYQLTARGLTSATDLVKSILGSGR